VRAILFAIAASAAFFGRRFISSFNYSDEGFFEAFRRNYAWSDRGNGREVSSNERHREN
jgi:hypothetical protein